MSLASIAPRVLAERGRYAQQFASADPFRHLVIDEFFEPAFIARLLAEFPAFERGSARNEAGELGGKSVNERIRSLGPGFAQLDDLVQSTAFLQLVSELTGIPDLLYDPHYFGGGTHENRAGQDLDPHVDFNRHPLTDWHRRLNLIVYLNPDWDAAWGGNLELHSDPRSPADRVTLVSPQNNRAVVFETTEHSWHGFSRIAPPAERGDLSRKSIALYFYTRERPAAELAAPHSTIYVDRPLPGHLCAGHTLDADDMQTLRTLIARRDQHIVRLYRDLQRQESAIVELRGWLAQTTLSRLAAMVRRVWKRLSG